MPAPSPLEVTEDQALHFRARRGHLAGPGAPDPGAAARAVLGGQAQQRGPALLALSQRTAGRPTAAEVERLLLEEPRSLVHTWGQRDTLHLYDADDWPLVHAARARWSSGGRRGAMPPPALVRRAKRILDGAAGPITRKDVLPAVTPEYLAVCEEVAAGRLDPAYLATSRLVWTLALRGDAYAAGKVGSEQTYASRTRDYPGLAWPEHEPGAAAAELARRYLAVHAPASAQDVAHFFKAKVTEARRWLATLEEAGSLVPVHCGGREGLVALAEDADDLARPAPRAARDWPLRLLPLWDTLLMGHADKSWTVPDEAERPLVWGRAAQVSAVALARGRVVATWRHTVRARHVEVEVRPLGRWSERTHAAGLRREAEAVARHLGPERAEVTRAT